MSFSIKTTALAVTFSCLFASTSPAAAQISPDILNLLIVASKKDSGANLDMVADIAIAANPEAEQSIRELVANLKKQNPVKTETPAPAPVLQAEAPKEKPAPVAEVVKIGHGFFSLKGWDGEVDLNFLRSSGNTSQESIGLGATLKRDSDDFHHTIESFFDLNRNTGVKDKQRWGISYKLDYDFSEKLYITSFAGYENDQFGAFRERITTSFGFGYPIIANDSYSWKVEGGPSVLFTKELPGSGFSSSFNAFASSLFDWTINARSHLTNKTVFYFGNKNVVESKTALKVKINGALSSKLSYDILYDQDAPIGRKKTDTVARAGLLYDF